MFYILLTYLVSPVLYLLLFFRQRDDVKKILIIQTAKIGDLICSTPVFREVKKKYSDAHLAVMATPVTKELLENNPHVDEIITINNVNYKGFAGKIRLSALIRKGEYDIAVCLNPNVPFAIALFWALVPSRISVMPNFAGITFKLASIFYTYLEKHNSKQLIVETYLKMLRAIGIESNNTSKEIYQSENSDIKATRLMGEIGKPLIGITVSSGNKLKELGAEMIARLVDMLSEDMDIYVVLIGSHQDRETAKIALASTGKHAKAIDSTGKLNLKELPALIERLSLFIGVDTGITYMADALSVPIVHIAGPVDISDQRPTGDNVTIIQHKIGCVPCTYVYKTLQVCKKGTRECINSEAILNGILEAARNIIKIGRPVHEHTE